jgi:hypothetical protein
MCNIVNMTFTRVNTKRRGIVEFITKDTIGGPIMTCPFVKARLIF